MRSVPRVARWMAGALLPRRDRSHILIELEELYAHRRSQAGGFRARVWYWWQAVAFPIRLFAERLLPRGGRGPFRRWTLRLGIGELLASGLQDLRYASRGLRRSPGFASVAVVTLALGIGANVALFSVINAVVLRPLPFPESHRIVTLSPERVHSPAQVVALRTAASAYTAQAASAREAFTLTADGTTSEFNGYVVGVEHFDVFGVEPALGRRFVAEDESPTATPIALLSYEFWQRHFGGAPGIIGRTVPIGGENATTRTIVGVMPRGYKPFRSAVEIYVPAVIDPANEHDYLGHARFRLMGRLLPEVHVDAARAELRRVVSQLSVGSDAVFRPERVESADVQRYHEVLVGDLGPTLWLLFASVGGILLIACVNVANLLLARAGARQREMAIRTALGAGQLRIMRQLLTENTLLGLLGGLVGLSFTWGGMSIMVAHLPATITSVGDVHVDSTVLLFALGLSVLTGAMFGLLPAWRTSRSLAAALRAGGRAATAGQKRLRLNSILVATEIALCVVLVVAAGLLVKSFWRLNQVDPGFDVEGLSTMRVALSPDRYGTDEARVLYFNRVEERIESVPGVLATGAIQLLPLTQSSSAVSISPDGKAMAEKAARFYASYRQVTPGYMSAMRIPLLSGRQLERADGASDPLVGLINEALANKLWPDGGVVGQQVVYDDGSPWFTVVGVVGDVHQNMLSVPGREELFLPYAQDPESNAMYLMVRADPGVEVTNAVKDAIWSVDPNVAISRESTMDAVIARSMAEARFSTLLFSTFALLALALGAVGVYGVLAYVVSQRTHEIGVRMALGANARDVVRGTMRSGMAAVTIGLVIGLLGAFATMRLLGSLLFGVTATDPTVYLGVVAVLVVVAALATRIPAGRAARVDPVVSLNSE